MLTSTPAGEVWNWRFNVDLLHQLAAAAGQKTGSQRGLGKAGPVGGSAQLEKKGAAAGGQVIAEEKEKPQHLAPVNGLGEEKVRPGGQCGIADPLPRRLGESQDLGRPALVPIAAQQFQTADAGEDQVQ